VSGTFSTARVGAPTHELDKVPDTFSEFKLGQGGQESFLIRAAPDRQIERRNDSSPRRELPLLPIDARELAEGQGQGLRAIAAVPLRFERDVKLIGQRQARQGQAHAAGLG